MQKRVEWPIGPTSQSAVPYPTEIFQTSLSLSQISESVLEAVKFFDLRLTSTWTEVERGCSMASFSAWQVNWEPRSPRLNFMRTSLRPVPVPSSSSKELTFPVGNKKKNHLRFWKKLVKSKWGISIYAFRGKEAFKRTLSVN